MSNISREDYIYYARLAEQGERYEDMIRYMKEVSRVCLLTIALLIKEPKESLEWMID